MIYTEQKRKELNEAFCCHFLDHHFNTNKNGSVRAIRINELLPGTRRVESITELRDMVPVHSKPWKSVVPVFIESKQMDEDGRSLLTDYRVNYVNCSEQSLEQASEYILSGKLYFIPELIINAYER